jgi:hypothetical protein
MASMGEDDHNRREIQRDVRDLRDAVGVERTG